MPYAPHYRLTLSGTLGNASPAPEQFSFGVSLAEFGDSSGPSGSVGGALTLDNDQKQDLANDCAAFFGDNRSLICSAARLRQVKLATIGADGKYLGDPFIAEVNVPGARAFDDKVLPQTSLCVSLVTARRGPTGKGRFYLPMPVVGISANDLTVQPVDIAFIAPSIGDWLNALNNEPNADVLGLSVVVASTKGYNSRVTGFRVGRALDTMRSRRRSLAEAYGATIALADNPA